MVLSIGPELLSHIPNTQRGAVLQISTHTSPALSGVTTAIGGGPALVRDGRIIDRDEVNVRNPRTAIGWNREYFYLVEVDGRQRYLSVGMTTQELSDYMIGLGCVSAMSLDGGGSATCWVYGQVMNRPSEGFERPMANSLVLVQKENK
jgi:exopolysaccharide biosynthesis protein